MSTRHAPEGAPISYERYMSSPEFAAMRGIPGTAVAAKAQLYSEARQRSLLFLRGVARALVKTLPGTLRLRSFCRYQNRYQARKNGRAYIASGDLRSALLNYRIPSDAALRQAFEPVEKRRMLATQTVGDSLASTLQRRCTRVA